MKNNIKNEELLNELKERFEKKVKNRENNLDFLKEKVNFHKNLFKLRGFYGLGFN
ncbi:MAG: hypothetical protein Q8O84_04545 [Nanoarchaeota archaeon]|nr:hypothetical protein [Nanoarchaeota archaeon]